MLWFWLPFAIAAFIALIGLVSILLLEAYPEVDNATEKRLLAISKQITSGAAGQNEEQA